MAISAWLAEHWFDLLQTAGIMGSLVFTGYAVRKDERARIIGNLIGIQDQYVRIWREMFERPQLGRVLKSDVNLKDEPMTDAEWLFVKMLILHLDTVRRATKAGMFVDLDGLQEDIRHFFGLPIPKAVWEKLKPFQDKQFITFIEAPALLRPEEA